MKHGHWEIDKNYYSDWHVCSICKGIAPLDPEEPFDEPDEMLTRYCPHCGARMDDADEN